ncbi:MAG: hypothetical protein Q8O94_01840 [bacterium]|nr:hypothetical protein [bacterium]
MSEYLKKILDKVADIDKAEVETAKVSQSIVDLFIAADASMGLIFSSLLTVLISSLHLAEQHGLISAAEISDLRREMVRAIAHPPKAKSE